MDNAMTNLICVVGITLVLFVTVALTAYVVVSRLRNRTYTGKSAVADGSLAIIQLAYILYIVCRAKWSNIDPLIFQGLRVVAVLILAVTWRHNSLVGTRFLTQPFMSIEASDTFMDAMRRRSVINDDNLKS